NDALEAGSLDLLHVVDADLRRNRIIFGDLTDFHGRYAPDERVSRSCRRSVAALPTQMVAQMVARTRHLAENPLPDLTPRAIRLSPPAPADDGRRRRTGCRSSSCA